MESEAADAMRQHEPLSDPAQLILRIPSVRRLRLFLSACCRYFFCDPHGGNIASESGILEPIEHYADGLLGEAERATARQAALGLDNYSLYADHMRGALVAVTSRFLFPEEVWFHLEEFVESQGYPADELPRLASQFTRDVIGMPAAGMRLEPSRLTADITDFAAMIYEDRAFDQMPELGDLCLAAGCDAPEIIDHCRQAELHIRGCWVLDWILGKK